MSLPFRNPSSCNNALSLQNKYSSVYVPLEKSFGLPGLVGLQPNKGAKANVDMALNLEFGWNRNFGFFMDTDKSQVKANVAMLLDNQFAATGNIGPFALEMTDNAANPTTANVTTTAKLKDLDDRTGYTTNQDDGNRFSLSEMSAFARNTRLTYNDLTQYTFTGNANLGLKARSSWENNSALPSLMFDLNVKPQLFNYANPAEANQQSLTVGVDNLQLDFGRFTSGMLRPFVERMNQIITPIKPIVKALNADTKLLSALGIADDFDYDKNGEVSILEMARKLAPLAAGAPPDIQQRIERAIQFAQVVSQVTQLVERLSSTPADQNLMIDLGSLSVDNFVTSGNVNKPELTNKKKPKSNIKTTRAPKKDPRQQADADRAESLMDTLGKLDNFKLPILEPANIVRLMLGDNGVDLITYDVPDMDFTFGLSKDFPVWGSLRGLLNGTVTVKTDLDLGFDSYGIDQWGKADYASAEIGKLLEGFYINDWDSKGNDKAELTVKGELSAGLSASAVVVRGTIKGGLEANIYADLEDVGEKTGKSDGKLRGSEILSRISNPQDLVELYGFLEAFLNAKIEAGVDVGLFEVMETVWERDLARFRLAEFGRSSNINAQIQIWGISIKGYLIGSEVFLDTNFNGELDADEFSTVTDSSGQFTLGLSDEQLQLVDQNQNGVIDRTEGRIVIRNGIDAATGNFFPGTLAAPVATNAVVTPLTTLIESLSRQTNTDPNTAQTQILQALNLPQDINLLAFNPLAVDASSSPEEILKAAQVYAADVQIQALSNLLQSATGKGGIDQITQLISTSAGQPVKLSDADTIDNLIQTLKPDIDPQVKAGVVAVTSAVLTQITSVPPSANSFEQLTKALVVAQDAMADLQTATPETISQLQNQYTDSNLTNKISAASIGNLFQPAGANAAITLPVNTPYTFKVADFGFQDKDLNATLKTLEVTGVPVFGELKLGDDRVIRGQTIAAADIQAGLLKFTPSSNEFGDNYGVLGFKVNDGSLSAAQENLFTIHIAPNYSILSSAASIQEGNTATSALKLTISRDRNTALSSIGFSIGGTAQRGSDYTVDGVDGITGQIRFEFGETSKTITLNVLGDTVVEADETVAVSIFNPSALPSLNNEAIGSVSVLIQNDDTKSVIEPAPISTPVDSPQPVNPNTPSSPTETPIIPTLSTPIPDIHRKGNNRSNKLQGDAGNDILWGKGANDKLAGLSGDDLLIGGQGNDRLKGDDGNDVLIGGIGNDVLMGGAGSDRFVVNHLKERRDTILDFSENDTLDLRGSIAKLKHKGSNTFADLVKLTRAGSNTIVSLRPNSALPGKNEELLLLKNITPNELTSKDFML